MGRLVVAAVFAAAVSMWATLSHASDPTFEKCTCDLERDINLTNGASVRNATACWSTEDPERQWCDIIVQAIEGDDRHQTILKELTQLKSNSDGMTLFLLEQAEYFLRGKNAPWRVQSAGFALRSVMIAHREQIAACIGGFIGYREKKEFATVNDETFSCRIGEKTGWLRMAFQVHGIGFNFMAAPNE
ncbi:hypothetical protein [Mesorhizobium sp. NPDC059025]|uniref:hypothetical protein n=1 Tax=unclassified Mesorhizobium TaxID=325217 RepID=UPI00367CB53A